MVSADPRRGEASGRPLGRVGVFGGGTGGHLVPGLALCEHILEAEPRCRIAFFRTVRAIEDRVLGGTIARRLHAASAAGRLEIVPLGLGAPGAGWGRRCRFAGQLLGAVSRVRRAIAARPIDVAIGLGGYASAAGILAARSERIPIVLLEQNAAPGQVNRYLGALADCIACPGAESLEGFGVMRPFVRLEETGNPLRREVLEARRWRAERSPASRRREIGAGERRVLLVMGGSQGARAVNRFVAGALPLAPEHRERVLCLHLTGARDRGEIEEAYRRAGWTARVEAFADDLPRLLAAADLVLARAGGTSIAEIAAIGVPSVLVPYPGHRDRHQYRNAAVLERQGAAIVLDEDRLAGDAGGAEAFRDLLDLLFDEGSLAAMERAAQRCACTDGADRVLAVIRAAVRRAASGSRDRPAPWREALALSREGR